MLKSVDQLRSRIQTEDKVVKSKREAAVREQAKVVSRTAEPTTAPLTISDIDYIRRQIERHWSFPAGAPRPEDLAVEVRIQLLPDGTVKDVSVVDAARMARPGEEYFRTAAESAVRAIKRASPLDLPPGKYEQLRDITLSFNPRDMVGR